MADEWGINHKPRPAWWQTRYRVARDCVFSRSFWAVQQWRWYWPFWTEFGNGLLETKDDALDLINELRTHR